MSYSNSFDASSHRLRSAHRTRMTHVMPRSDRRRASLRPALRRRPTLLQLVGTVALIAGLALACWFALAFLSSLVGGTSAANAQGLSRSDPESTWNKGVVPSLYQQDPAWAQASYAGGDFSETGCGPTCIAMVYVALTGRDDKNPADMGALSEQLGCASSEGTAWLFMTEGAAQLGLSSSEIPADEASVRQAILSGSPVVCSMGPGDFTTTGHFIVLTGIDKQGRLVIRDPNSPERTARTWAFDVVLGQCRALWSYTAA